MSLRSRMSVPIFLFLAIPSIAATAPKERIAWVPAAGSALGLYVSNADGTNERPLVVGPGPNYNPSFSPDGRWIVFTSERFGSADMFRVHPDGSDLERLTDDPAFDDQGALSPDGRTLAFVSTRDGGTANIWLQDVINKGRPINLTKTRSGNFRPSWSPDGKWIAFSSDRDIARTRYIRETGPAWELMQRTAIYIVHPDGSGLRRLTALGGCAGSPKWSRDGRRVLFYEVADVQGMRHFRWLTKIVSMDIATGAREVYSDGTHYEWSPSYIENNEIAYGEGDPRNAGSSLKYTSGRNGPARAQNPAWSPDGSVVVYDKDVPSKQSWTVVRPSRDPRYELIDGTPFNTFSAAFGPDGRWIVYQSDGQLTRVALDGTGSRVIFDGSGHHSGLGKVALSADGRKVAFEVSDTAHPETMTQLAVMDSDGSHFRVVTRDRAYNQFPGFSPDGSELVYCVSTRENGQRVERGLRILSLANGSVINLTSDWDNTPAWSPRGDRIAFTSFKSGDFEIYTIRPDGTGLRQLTHTHGNDAHPVWSPDGKWIAFVSSRMGWKDEALVPWHGLQMYGEIFVMRADGTEVRQLTDNQWEEGVVGWAPPVPAAAGSANPTGQYR
jgi:TolB protein